MLLLWVVACASYAPGDAEQEALESSDTVQVTTAKWLSFEPSEPIGSVGLMFYPGGLVQPEAYAPPIRRFAEAGIPSYILPMPADLAIFGIGRGEWLLEAYPEISTWVLAGHSLGAVAAASFAQDHPDVVAGLSMWAGYPAGSVDLSTETFPVLSIVGSRDGLIDWNNWEDSAQQLPEQALFLQIGGANHAQFGDYGHQDGDLDAHISARSQWAFAVERTLDLLTDEGP